jgi:hypothetical protein
MSSIGSAPRQIPVGLQYYPTYQNNAKDIASSSYVFIPDSGNYVGNYPPGHVVPLTEFPDLFESVHLFDDIRQNIPTVGAKSPLVLRDTGKTIFALVYKDAVTPSDVKGYFRQVQVLIPQPITATQGFLGGVNGSTFGVYGSIPQYVPYATIYLPTNVDGVFVNSTGNFLLDPTPQGQM